MNPLKGRGMNMVFILVVGAILLAVATFVGLNLVANRTTPPARPDLPQTVLVDGVVITLNADPDKAIYLEGQVLPTIVPQQDDLSAAPTTVVILEPTLPPPTIPPPTATPVPEPVIFINFQVGAGDSLYSIAEQQNSSIELMALHGIDSNDLVAGNLLNLPIANPAYCPGNRAYVVRDKDTVYRISVAFTTTKEAIAQLNNLDANYTIFATQVICIPT